jgi:hypothetical protein
MWEIVKGRTVMIPKGGNSSGEPDKFRPITFLNTMYKLLTGVLTEVLYEHVMTQGLLPGKQKALRKGQRGCLDTLVIEAIASEAKLYCRNLIVAWVDYRKAYNMVPHCWLRKVLRE